MGGGWPELAGLRAELAELIGAVPELAGAGCHEEVPESAKLIFRREKKKALWAPCTLDKGASECPATVAQHPLLLFGLARLRKVLI